jgi:DNA-binding MarR family transcriptional regulator
MPEYKVIVEELATYSMQIEAIRPEEASAIAISRLNEHDSNSQFSKTTDARSVSVVEVPQETVPPITERERKTAGILLNVLDQVRAEHGNMPIAELKALFTIATNGSKSIGEYARMMDLPPASMSQIVKNLGDAHRSREECRGLIDTRPARDDNRRREVFLTDRGHALANKIARIISGSDVPSD